MKIGFTGHRNRSVSPELLEALVSEFPGAIWVHGGAQGFDNQVNEFARHHYIQQIFVRPDYEAYPPDKQWQAAMDRDVLIVNQVGLVIACYDGRKKGGTYQTLRYARSTKKPVRIWEAMAAQ